MNLQRFLCVLMLAFGAWSLPIDAARANTLYDSTSLIQGQQSFVQSFSITTPGTLTITLSNIPWLDTVSGLTGFLTTASGVIGKSMGAGTQSYDVSAGTLYAQWFGEAQGTYNLGVVGINITFQPKATPVPLPTSLLLMLSGLGLLFGWQSRKGPALGIC